MPYLLSLKDKVAVVTGGGGGLGHVISGALAEAGAQVVIASRNLAACESAAATFSKFEMFPYAVDVTDRSSIERMVQTVTERFGRIDILVNNAGISPFTAPMLRTRASGLKRLLDVNVIGALECAQACAAPMIARGEGVMINVASSAAAIGVDGIGAYAVSKAALVKLTQQLAGEWGPLGIRVNAIAPGFMGVGMAKYAEDNEGLLAPLLSRTPLGRTGRPEEIAAAMVFLASDESRYISGQTLYIDGGASTW